MGQRPLIVILAFDGNKLVKLPLSLYNYSQEEVAELAEGARLESG